MGALMYDYRFGRMTETRAILRISVRLAMKVLLIGGFLLIAWISFAYAQSPPQGVGGLNQAIQARLLVKSDSTVFPMTRGLYIGDATVCNIAIRFDNDTVAVTFASVQPGSLLPFSVRQLMSASTTCTSVIALY